MIPLRNCAFGYEISTQNIVSLFNNLMKNPVHAVYYFTLKAVFFISNAILYHADDDSLSSGIQCSKRKISFSQSLKHM